MARWNRNSHPGLQPVQVRHFLLNLKLELASLSCSRLYSLLGLVTVLVSVKLLGTHLQTHEQLQLVPPLVSTDLR